jgi:predicted dehydrogenase
MGFNFRFHPLILEMRAAVTAGDLGTIAGARSTFSAARRELPDWKQTEESGGGVLLDLDSHQIDLVRFIFSQDILEVASMTRSVASLVDTSCSQLRLADGTLVDLFSSLAAVEQHRFEILGSAGQLTFDRYGASRLSFLPATRAFGRADRLAKIAQQVTRWPQTLRDLALPPTEQSFRTALNAFVNACRGVRVNIPDITDGYASLATVIAAQNAASSGAREQVNLTLNTQ